MSKLTLDQVLEAGRFAEAIFVDDLQWFTNDGVHFAGGYTESDGYFEEVDSAGPGGYDALPKAGWLHELGCDCAFCKEA